MKIIKKIRIIITFKIFEKRIAFSIDDTYSRIVFNTFLRIHSKLFFPTFANES